MPCTFGFRIFYILFFALQMACEAEHFNEPFVDGSDTEKASIDIYETSLYKIVQLNCAQCHGVNQEPLFAVSDLDISHQTLVNKGLINFSDSSDSFIVEKIRNGHQSFEAQLAEDIEISIAQWATGLQESIHEIDEGGTADPDEFLEFLNSSN